MNAIQEAIAVLAMALQGLRHRWTAALVTLVGVGSVVAVMISLLAMAAGLSNSALKNIDPAQVIVLSAGAPAEHVGALSPQDVAVISAAPGVRRDARNRPMAQAEALVLVEVATKADGAVATSPFRGVGAATWSGPSAPRIVRGRLYRSAVHELVVGAAAQRAYRNLDIGDHVTLRGVRWDVVGTYDDRGGLSENGLMGEAETVRTAFARPGYQSVRVQLTSRAVFPAFRDALAADPRLNVDARLASDYIGGQVRQLTNVLNFVGLVIGSIMALGATCAALMTMYATVESRLREIATLRTLGFGGGAVLSSIMVESMLLSLPGAALGAGLAWALFNGNRVATSGFNFAIDVSPRLVGVGVAWALAIGLLGGLAPALRAARLPLAAALRAT